MVVKGGGLCCGASSLWHLQAVLALKMVLKVFLVAAGVLSLAKALWHREHS